MQTIDIDNKRKSFRAQKRSSFLQQHLHLRHGLISSVFAVSPTWVGCLKVTKKKHAPGQKRKMISDDFRAVHVMIFGGVRQFGIQFSCWIGKDMVYWGASLAVDKHWKAVADSNHVWADAYVWISKFQWFGDVWNEANSVNDQPYHAKKGQNWNVYQRKLVYCKKFCWCAVCTQLIAICTKRKINKNK